MVVRDPPEELLTAESVGTISRVTEQVGFGAVAFSEHPATPQSWRLDPAGHDQLDPFAALAVAGAATTSLLLLTYLAVVPYYNPFQLAKTTATVDRLSGGRLVLG